MALLLGGMVPALAYWPWAKVFFLLWAAFWLCALLRRGPRNAFVQWAFLLLFAFSFWSLSMAGLPSYAFRAALAGGALLLLVRAIRRDSRPADEWPQPFALWTLAGILWIGPAAHAVFGWLLGKPFQLQWWVPAALGAYAVLVAGPPAANLAFTRSFRTAALWACPLLMIATAAYHAQKRAEIFGRIHSGDQLESAAREAIGRGYPDLEIQAVLGGVARLRGEGRLGEAVNTLRTHWLTAGRGRVREAYEAHPALGADGRLWLIAEGGRLVFGPGESARDLLWNPLLDNLFVLTDRGRVLVFGETGVGTHFSLGGGALAFDMTQDAALTAVLADGRSLVLKPAAGEALAVANPGPRPWVDVALDGAAAWLLDANGGVWRVGADSGGDAVPAAEEVHPPLWGEGLEQAAALMAGGGEPLILDQCGGVIARTGGEAGWNGFSPRDLSRHYNPERCNRVDIRILHDAGLWILDRNGRLDRIVPGIAGEAAGLETERKHAVRARFDYDKSRAVWDWSPTAVAFTGAPEADTILLLRSDGLIEAIAMPGGVRLTPWDAPYRVSAAGGE